MDYWMIGLVLKPIAALAVLVPALMCCRVLHRVMPDSRAKRLLFSPLPGHKPRRWD